jgi:muramoyltetrapeptide carboxypeptidase
MTPRLPPPVRPGARVGVAALSGPVDAARLEAGLDALRGLGFEPVPAANLTARKDLFAGDDGARLEAFHALASRPEVEAIFFARGGHGVLRLLPAIDWELLGRYPRAYVGYSDLTPLLAAVVDRLGLVAFHGPLVAAELARGLGDAEQTSLLGALAGDLPSEVPCEGVLGDLSAAPSGRLVGGCLSMLTATLGTPWFPRCRGGILFLEDVGEPLFRIDRMLTHLDLSGSLTGVRGIVVGEMRGTDEAALGPSTVPARVAQRWPRLPVAFGLPVGHAAPNLTLPLGLTARFDPHAHRLVLDRPEPAQ